MHKLVIIYLFIFINNNFIFFFTKVKANMTLSNPMNLEFAKDLAALTKESNFGSFCESNNFILTRASENYINFIGRSQSQFGPPIILTTYQSDGEREAKTPLKKWRFSKFHNSCHLIIVFALFDSCTNTSDENVTTFENENGTIGEAKNEATSILIRLIEVNGNSTSELNSNLENRKMEESNIGIFNDFNQPSSETIVIPPPDFLSIPNLIQDHDQTLYLSNHKYSDNMALVEPEDQILEQNGIMLSVRLENQTKKESLFRVYSRCKYCGRGIMNKDMGVWRRNQSLFSDFIKIFTKYQELSFHEYKSFQIGYVDYFPHISCVPSKGVHNCSGIEWEMLKQISRSLQFTFDLRNFSSQGVIYEPKNITGMIGAVRNNLIDIALGGVSVSHEKATVVDFSNIFTNHPIVFVIQKRTDLYILGIWLAFAPEVWPLIIFTIVSIAIIIRLIMWRTNHRKRTYKPSVAESLEISIQPLLGQALSSHQIPRKPRRLLKLVLGIWWFSCLIISTVYNTNLITSLINPVSPKEPDSLEDLLASGYRFKVASDQSALLNLISKGSDDKVSKHIQARLLDESHVSYNYHPIAYIVEESAVAQINWKEKTGLSSIRVIRERLFLTGYGWMLKKQAPYKNKINTAITQLSAAGCIQHWYNKFTNNEKKLITDSRFRLREKIGQVKLNLELLQGAFIFLILGSSLAILVLVWEILKSNYTFRFFTRHEIFGFCKTLVNKMQVFDFGLEITNAGRFGFILVDPLSQSIKEVNKDSDAHKFPSGYYPFLK